MVYSVEDCILIKNLYNLKNYGAKKLIREFPGKGWTVSGLNKLLRKLRTLAVREGVKEADDLAVRAPMTTLILSMN
jgi:hypothetical protein